MSRKVFYSFHFDDDNWRAGQVRNMGSLENDKPINGNRWEDVKENSNYVIEDWIETNLKDKSCLVVLIGYKTSERKWVQYEIKRALELKKAICGVYIHKLEDRFGKQSYRGKNPLPNSAPVFESGYISSSYIYNDIKENIGNLVEKAIQQYSR